MNRPQSLTEGLQSCVLSEYLKNSCLSLDTFQAVKTYFSRSSKYNLYLLNLTDGNVINLTQSLRELGLNPNANMVIEYWDYDSWRTQISETFDFDYERTRFMRRTTQTNLIRKASDHERYSFILQKSKGANHCILQFNFKLLDREKNVIVCICEDITRNLEHDFITGGLNREGLLSELHVKFATLTEPGQLSVLYFNIQNFHLINEQYGDEVGDRVLQAMYVSLVYSDLKPMSYARYGADKFVCLVRRETLHYDELLNLCHQEFVEGDLKIPFRCLCGIYHVQTPEDSPVHACDYAKLATLHIKDRFLQPWMEFSPQMQNTSFSDSEILSQIDAAIANKEFIPYYQPIVSTQTGQIVMAEALVRWKSPVKGMVSPGIFIPVLERHGGLSRIDMIMEERVTSLQRRRTEAGLPTVPIDINLSWVDFADSDLLKQLYSHIQDGSVSNDLVRYEITETALADIADNRYDVLDFFKEHHVKLLIDDFGQAYSFGTLKDVNFHIIKIDKSMIDQIGTSRKVNLLLETMINMFHTMHTKVVAEGVETEKQLAYLRQVGCDYIQGYYFYRPMDEAAFTELLDSAELGQEDVAADTAVQDAKLVAETHAETNEKKDVKHRAKRALLSFGTVKLEDLKSTFLIVAICGILSAVIYFTTYTLVSDLVTASCDELTVRDIDKIKLHIDLELSATQEALNTFSTTVFQNGLSIPKTEEEIYQQMELFLANTPMLSGIVAGFEDEIFPAYADRLGFGPLVRNQGDSLVRYQVGEIRDFRQTKEWYSECLAQEKARWSAPFFSEEGDIIIDYCIPLKDAKGTVIGVVAADLSISHLRKVVEDIKPYPTSIVMVMQEDLTFVIHPDKGYPMHKTLPVFLKERGIVADQTLLGQLREGRKGKMILNPLGEDLFLYYDVIDKAGYRLLIESQSTDVYAKLNHISKVMTWIGFGGLFFLILTLGFMIYDNKKRERRGMERNMRILQHTADTDGLTGLFNRTAGERRVVELLTDHTPGVLSIIDCDKFKLVNDLYGHSSGDQVLIKLSEALKYCFPDDVVLRLGGDEFAVFCLKGNDRQAFEDKVKLFFVELSNIRIEGMGDYHPAVSMGAANYDGEEDIDFDRLYKIADRLLYESKKTEGSKLSI